MADTVTILSTSVFSGSTTLTSEKVKGDAYFGQSDGLHTITVNLNDFIGTIKIQGSLETTPSDGDFFDINLSDEEFTVDVSGLVTKKVLDNLIYNVSETSMKSYNATGNFVWLRADIINWQSGTISSIEMNR
jgi:hypothetical protein|tara:strand:- start:210 stop:605 length:396 start_codon:yes stop_codon:yes gene_type:complete